MKGPLKHMPLAVCDKRSVKLDRVVPTSFKFFAPFGPFVNLSLKYSDELKFYYYPDMTSNEVLAFKQYHFEKREDFK